MEEATSPEAGSAPGVDLAAVRSWVRVTLPDVDPGPLTVSLISGGKSNLTYRLTLADRTLVLRRPPLGNVLPTAHDMDREFRVLLALWGSEIPVARPIAFCADEAVIGAPFYVMDYVEGTTIRTLDEARALTATQARELSESLAAMLAAIHRVDVAALGREPSTRRYGFLARQIDRWWRQWQQSRTRDLKDLEDLVARLEQRRPDSDEVSLVHGDYRVDNTLVRLGAPVSIAAVVDWEMSTIGHPLADLGLALTYWADPGDEERLLISAIPPVTSVDGFYSTTEFAEAYARHSGRDLAELNFYLALGCFKLAVILEGIHSRHLAHNTVGDGFDDVGAAVPVLVSKGLRVLGR
jgi:aminoglycoside phosphotransferase (APT) family kinase protein